MLRFRTLDMVVVDGVWFSIQDSRDVRWAVSQQQMKGEPDE